MQPSDEDHDSNDDFADPNTIASGSSHSKALMAEFVDNVANSLTLTPDVQSSLHNFSKVGYPAISKI